MCNLALTYENLKKRIQTTMNVKKICVKIVKTIYSVEKLGEVMKNIK